VKNKRTRILKKISPKTYPLDPLDPRCRIRKKFIPDPGSRGLKITGSGSATLRYRMKIRSTKRKVIGRLIENKTEQFLSSGEYSKKSYFDIIMLYYLLSAISWCMYSCELQLLETFSSKSSLSIHSVIDNEDTVPVQSVVLSCLQNKIIL
jgi:hypothetical protein